MEELFRRVLEYIALGVKAGAALFIAIGALEAIYQVVLRLVDSTS